ncbi:MAG: nitroreductase [Burkholderiales bacterium RIFCSPLOWO2_12_FULL_61_40]|nr:MAG: nitroreductase [Burkholderiales bacterium RIFCSPLOWO2_12_FULL_61_40]
MDTPRGPATLESVSALMHARQNVSAKRLVEPGPSAQQLQQILESAAAAPDHGQLRPWRFVVVPADQRGRLSEVFGQALLDRDPQASPDQLESAREKAHRAPLLIMAIVRLTDQSAQPGTAPGRGAQHPESSAADVSDAERLVSLGCAIQNMLLSAQAAGFGAGLTSGQAMASPHLRALFGLYPNEQAVCCINIGTVSKHKPPRVRPALADFVTYLDCP